MKRVQLARNSMSAVKAGAHLNAFISLKEEQALIAEAKSADLRRSTGNEKSQLDGVLIAVKDNICTTDLPTTCASKMLRDYISPYEATVVKDLREVGAIIMGKTNMDEFGMGSHSIHSTFGAVSRPGTAGDQSRSAGGSSGGSAAAVASGMCYAALGTDTGGSVRLPASYCGIVGFKPSYGMLSRWGVVAYANSLDTVGVMARDIAGVRKVFGMSRPSQLYPHGGILVLRILTDITDAINRHDPNDPTSLSQKTRERIHDRLQWVDKAKPLRIGVPEEYNLEEVTSPVRSAWEKVISRMEKLDHTITPVSLPHTKHALSAYYVLAPAEASSNLAKYDGVRYGHRDEKDRSEEGEILFAPTRRAGFGEEVRRRILMGAYALSSEAIDNYFIQAQKVRRLVQNDFDNVFVQPNWLRLDDRGRKRPKENKVDVLITPCSLSTAPLLEDVRNESSPLDSYVNDVLTVPASLAGIPAISIPIKVEDQDTEEELQVGIQVMAQYGDEATLWEVAKILEKSFPT